MGLNSLPWTGSFTYHHFDVISTYPNGASDTMEFYFSPQTLSLKYWKLKGESIYLHIDEDFIEKSFTDADFAKIDNCDGYPPRLRDDGLIHQALTRKPSIFF